MPLSAHTTDRTIMKELSPEGAASAAFCTAPAAMFQAATYQFPDSRGHFGPYGGTFVSETLSHAISELKEAYARYQHDPDFWKNSVANSNTSSAARRRCITPSAGLKSRAVRRFS
jgi:hypothetical protein